MSKALVKLSNVGNYAVIGRDTTDDALIAMWLKKGKAANTIAAYTQDVKLFKRIVNKPMQAMTLEDLQAFTDALLDEYEHETSRVRVRNAIKSLFSFAMQVGYIRVNPAAMVEAKKVPSNVAAMILTEEQVLRMFDRAKNERDRLILRILYESAVRVSELCNLTWADVQPNATTGGQITVYGKGDKRRSIAISKTCYELLTAQRGEAEYNEPVFPSPNRPGQAISRVQIFNIVSAAASDAKVPGKVSPHWLRHAHASHALDRLAPVHLVRDTLGHASIVTTNVYVQARPNESSSTFLITATK